MGRFSVGGDGLAEFIGVPIGGLDPGGALRPEENIGSDDPVSKDAAVAAAATLEMLINFNINFI